MKKLKNVLSLKHQAILTTIDLAGSQCLEGMRTTRARGSCQDAGGSFRFREELWSGEEGPRFAAAGFLFL